MSETNPADKTVGMRHLTAVLAAMLAVFVAACAATPTQESTGGYIDDSTITAKIKTDLALDPKVSAAEIHVRTYKGVVDLSGFVDAESQVTQAAEIASKVDGVRSVQNDLIVKGAVAPSSEVEKRAQ